MPSGLIPCRGEPEGELPGLGFGVVPEAATDVIAVGGRSRSGVRAHGVPGPADRVRGADGGAADQLRGIAGVPGSNLHRRTLISAEIRAAIAGCCLVCPGARIAGGWLAAAVLADDFGYEAVIPVV